MGRERVSADRPHGANFPSSEHEPTHAHIPTPTAPLVNKTPRARAQTEPNRTLWTHGENACEPSQVTKRHGSSGAKLASSNNKKDAVTLDRSRLIFLRDGKKDERAAAAQNTDRSSYQTSQSTLIFSRKIPTLPLSSFSKSFLLDAVFLSACSLVEMLKPHD